MEYEFVRFKNLATDEESHKWWFAAKTARQVMEHAEKFFKPTMQEGYSSAAHDAVEAIFKHGGIMNHPTNEVASSIEAITEIKGYKRSSPLRSTLIMALGSQFFTMNSIHLAKSNVDI